MAIEIITQRLRLRPWQRKDRPALEQMCRDEDMMQHVTRGRPMTNKQIREFLKRQKRHLKKYQVCFFAMEQIESQHVIGLAGLQPHDDGIFELGWWVWKDHWGHGYATEAGDALIDYARNTLNLSTVVAVIDPENITSIRVAEKLGLTFECNKPASETISTRPDWLIGYYSRTL